MVEINKEIVTVQSRLAIINSVPSTETKKLRYINSKLRNDVSILEKIILEFKEDLNLSKVNLQKLESDFI